TTDGIDQEAGETDMSTSTCRKRRQAELPCHVGDPDLWFAENPADLERAKQRSNARSHGACGEDTSSNAVQLSHTSVRVGALARAQWQPDDGPSAREKDGLVGCRAGLLGEAGNVL